MTEVVSLAQRPAVLFARLHCMGKHVRAMYVHSRDEALRFLGRSPLPESQDRETLQAVWFGETFFLIPRPERVPAGTGVIEYD